MRSALTSIWFWLAVGLLLIFSAFHAVYAADLSDRDRMQTQMLGVSAQLNENCSSTLIWSNRDQKSGEVTTLVLTAKHCVEDATHKEMVVDIPIYQDGRVVKKDRYLARLKAQDYASDLALVELKDKQTWFEKTASVAPEKIDLFMGERVWTVGYPLAFNLTVSEGLFGMLQTIEGGPTSGDEYFRATSDATFGNSGGSLFTKDADGNYVLLGVTSMRFNDNTFMGLYTPLSAIRDFLKRVAPEAIGEGADKATGPSGH